MKTLDELAESRLAADDFRAGSLSVFAQDDEAWEPRPDLSGSAAVGRGLSPEPVAALGQDYRDPCLAMELAGQASKSLAFPRAGVRVADGKPAGDIASTKSPAVGRRVGRRGRTGPQPQRPSGAGCGDQLTPLLCRCFSGQTIEWAPVHEADLIAVGSLLDRRFWREETWRTFAGHIWGSGRMTDEGTIEFGAGAVEGDEGVSDDAGGAVSGEREPPIDADRCS